MNIKMAIALREHAILLYHLSFMGFLTGLVGIHNDKPYLGLTTCVCSVFAQNYWIDPQYGLRRNMDIACVQLAMWLHLWYAYSPLYITIQGLGVAFYGISWYYQKRDALWRATLCHAMVHVCANGSIMMYYLT